MSEDKVEYEQRILPDKKRLSAMLREAKGEGRTMAQLAEVCGVSASSLSRILTGKTTKPLSIELLRAIAENSASPRITLDVLAKANGMRPKGENASGFEMRHRQRLMESRDCEMSVRNLISNELLNRECEVRFLPSHRFGGDESQIKESAYGLSVRWSCLMRTDAFKTGNIENWGIITDTSVGDGLDARERRYSLYSMGRFCSSVFLSDLWEPDLLRDTKISFAFVDRLFYDMFLRIYGKQKVNNYMSVILLDLQKGEIIEEKAFQRIDGGTCPLLQDIPEVKYDEEMQDFPWAYLPTEEENPRIYKDQNDQNNQNNESK